MRGERSTRTCRGAHYIGYDKRVDAPWFIVLSAFVSSRIPHQCTCDFGVLGSIDPTSSAPSCESVHATRCTSLRVYLQPCARTGTYTCKHRRVTTPPAAAFGRPQDTHTGIGPRGAFARTALRSQRGPPATSATTGFGASARRRRHLHRSGGRPTKCERWERHWDCRGELRRLDLRENGNLLGRCF